jgi:Surface-adhesin protein E
VEINMIRKLIAGLALALSGSAFAAPQWVQLPNVDNVVTYVDRASVERVGSEVTVRVLRVYDKVLTLGNDPTTGADMYPHRSVKIRYVVDCNAGRIALESWEMYSGNLGDGEVVWADQAPGRHSFYRASTVEESHALAVACGVKAAMYQSVSE